MPLSSDLPHTEGLGAETEQRPFPSLSATPNLLIRDSTLHRRQQVTIPINSSLCFSSKMSAFTTSTFVFSLNQGKRHTICPRSRRLRLTTKRRSQALFHRTIPKALEALVLTEENVCQALDEVKVKLGSVFGNNTENRDVGITGEVELASLDGPIVVLRLKGRFWHKRADVLARVSAYLSERIPEICDIEIEDAQQLQDSEEESKRLL